MSGKSIFKLAWRNIWRNRRRSLITLSSVAFAVLASVAMSSFQSGTWNHMMQEVVEMQTGYVQVMKKDALDRPSINDAIPMPHDSIWQGVKGVSGLAARIQSFALAAEESRTRPVMVMGVQPEQQKELSDLENRMVKGKYWNDPKDPSVIIDSHTAEYFQFSPGDTLVLISSGFRGANAAGKFPIKGILKMPGSTRSGMIYMTLKEAQWFYRTEGRITSWIPLIENSDAGPQVAKTLKERIDTSAFDVMEWEEMIPDLVESRVVDEAGSYVVMGILYMIIAFGIFGTLLMMMKERQYEMGILNAIGMKKRWLSVVVWLELLTIAALGTLVGIAITMPLVAYFFYHPIELSGDMAEAYEQFGVSPLMTASLDASIFINQSLVVLVMVSFISIYPFFKIARMNLIEALRQ